MSGNLQVGDKWRADNREGVQVSVIEVEEGAVVVMTIKSRRLGAKSGGKRGQRAAWRGQQ